MPQRQWANLRVFQRHDYVFASCVVFAFRVAVFWRKLGSVFAVALLHACGTLGIAWWLAERQPYPRWVAHRGVHVGKTATR